MVMWTNLKTLEIQRTNQSRKRKEDLAYLDFEVKKVYEQAKKKEQTCQV